MKNYLFCILDSDGDTVTILGEGMTKQEAWEDAVLNETCEDDEERELNPDRPIFVEDIQFSIELPENYLLDHRNEDLVNLNYKNCD